MIHFDEMACLLYLEGQLDPARSHELAEHVGQCAPCREMLQALHDETNLLSSALTEENESIPARVLRGQEQPSPSWVWSLAFGSFAVAVYWFWAYGIGPWFDQLNNAGFGGTDMFSMVLFGGAFWEGWSEMIDAIQIGALIVLAFAGIAWIRRRLRRRSVSLAIVLSGLIFALAAPQPAGAADVRRGRAVFIPAGETVHNDLIAAGPSVRIDGIVEGDVIAFTRSLNVTGHVTGDVIAFAGETVIDGNVDGNVRVFTRSVIVQGNVAKNVSAIANTIDLVTRGTVGGSVIAIAAEGDLDGKMQRDLLGILARGELDGFIGGQAWIRGGDLEIGPAAEIRGPATFQGPRQPVVEAGAKLASPLHTEITQEVGRRRRSLGGLVLRAIFRFGVSLGVGLLLLVVLPGFFYVTLRETSSIGLPIGVGALALITGLVLLGLGVLLLIVGVVAGMAGAMALAPALYLAQVFVGTWLGNRILGEKPHATGVVMGRMALGLLILHVARLIPILGVLTWLVVWLWGTGAVLMGIYRVSRSEAMPAAPLPA